MSVPQKHTSSSIKALLKERNRDYSKGLPFVSVLRDDGKILSRRNRPVDARYCPAQSQRRLFEDELVKIFGKKRFWDEPRSRISFKKTVEQKMEVLQVMGSLGARMRLHECSDDTWLGVFDGKQLVVAIPPLLANQLNRTQKERIHLCNVSRMPVDVMRLYEGSLVIPAIHQT
eukprot:TRINITY_DN1379_c0_g1_i5.p1 TRINITY_DN1379_c0_g1~~TRINITY_DN1379_c0_g1_i5.p1  ORF type:complete len:173 (-),score=30.10 TRINITY_DN1379_c0_g1_i5:538-1056(-)